MRVLCVATHPDDETLGPGGTLLRHIADGDDVVWHIVCDALGPTWSDEYRAAKDLTIGKVAKIFGFSDVVRSGLPAASLDQVADGKLVEEFVRVIAHCRPDTIYLNHAGDAHSDHRRVFAAAMAALKPFKTGSSVGRILAYETPSETEQAPSILAPFLPNSFTDVSEFIDKKIAIFDLYKSEQHAFPLPREASAIAALARWRGATIGVAAAEAFMLVREVV